jgi:hypothetical protein
VVGGTVHALRKTGGNPTPVDLLVVDEGSQLELGDLAMATRHLAPGGRVVLAGDHHQLPPIIHGTYPEAEDGRAGLEDSCFAYLYDRQDEADPYVVQLTDDFRMNRVLSGFAAETLYGPEYRPATKTIGDRRIGLGRARSGDGLMSYLLDPAYPLVLAIPEDIHAGLASPIEAGLVARAVVALRERLLDPATGKLYPKGQAGDAAFFRTGLFVVAPHHVQIEAVRAALAQLRDFDVVPFVDTVDKMQGQQTQAVLVSYGVSDPETALAEAEFIYSRNRLNVSVTRAQAKCIVFLPRMLLEPPLGAYESRRASEGIGHMQALVSYALAHGETRSFTLDDEAGALTVIRA